MFEVFLPQLLLYPNATDPLNGEAAALLLREPEQYQAKIRGASRFPSTRVPDARAPLAPSPSAPHLTSFRASFSDYVTKFGQAAAACADDSGSESDGSDSGEDSAASASSSVSTTFS